MTGNVDTWLHIVGIGEDGMAGLLPAPLSRPQR